MFLIYHSPQVSSPFLLVVLFPLSSPVHRNTKLKTELKSSLSQCIPQFDLSEFFSGGGAGQGALPPWFKYISKPIYSTSVSFSHTSQSIKDKNKGRFLKDFIYLFLERGGGREKEREKSIGLQPGHAPWPGIEPATFGFASRHSIHGATPASAKYKFLI